jgi:hypothetical protein
MTLSVNDWRGFACDQLAALRVAGDRPSRSVLAYVMPPVFLAVVADRVVSVVRRPVLCEHEQSPWHWASL